MLHYASFSQRFGALVIDSILMTPLVVAAAFIEVDSLWLKWFMLIADSTVIVCYPIVGHALFGKTIGKWAVRIRVVTLAGERIGWKHALLRSSVELLFWAAGIAETYFDYFGRPEPASFAEVTAVVGGESTLSTTLDWLSWVWAGSEIVVMLFNEQRRALHDFIAGTIVVKE